VVAAVVCFWVAVDMQQALLPYHVEHSTEVSQSYLLYSTVSLMPSTVEVVELVVSALTQA